MLILTRRPVETLYIGDEITVTVLGVVGNQVRFGIEAPRHIVIDRAEIHERKKRAALANGNPARDDEAHGSESDHERGAHENDDVNGNVLDDAETLSVHDDARRQADGNEVGVRLRR